MLNFIKFSQFVASNPNDATTQNVGLASGVNVRNPKFLIWTTAMRPTAPFNGLLGFNTDLEQYEYWNSVMAAWVQLANSSGSGTINPGTTGELGFYASNGNTISGLTVSPESVLGSNTSGFPVWLGPLTDGQIIIGKTGFTPLEATLTAGSGISIVNGPGSITISSSASGGTVTAVSQGAGIVCTPNPIVSTGTVALATTLPANEIIPTPTINQGTINQPTIKQPNIVGVTDGSDAAAGSVGQEISNVILSGSAIGISNGTPTDLMTISLDGDFDVYGNIFFNASGTVITQTQCWISLVSSTAPDSTLRTIISNSNAWQNSSIPAPTKRVNVAGATTVYLTAYVALNSGTCTISGQLFARRRR